MSLRINTNVTALNALRNLQDVSTAVSRSIERLSSGLRINRAADDPAGLIISESLRAQIDG
ncbi:MAG: flagellin, partial [Chloroherpetonaceae bacterium]|nr:flagellin [Chloroherpetonaceae bacterium]